MARTEIKNKIRRLRFGHDEMTQQALANGVEVTRQTIIAMEAGKYAPSMALAFRIARFFDTRVEDVFIYGNSTDPTDHAQVRRQTRRRVTSGEQAQ